MTSSEQITTAAPNILQRPQGRRLAWTENGAADGRPVLLLHGSPGCRLSRYADDAQLKADGIRQISYDRPGYGGSDPQPGRSVRDAVADIAAILDAAGVARAGLLGVSGGGPHVLAAATLLAARVTLAYCHAGVAPRQPLGAAFFDGMDAQNVRRLRSAEGPRDEAHAALQDELAQIVAAARSGDPLATVRNMQIPQADIEIIQRSAAANTAAVLEALRPGYWGFVDDFSAVARDWGFDPRQAAVPVVIEYGLQDVNVPAAHGAWLAAHIPRAEVVVNEAGGHRSTPEQTLARLRRVAAAGGPQVGR